jgi:predicted outer membrane lipoprotein
LLSSPYAATIIAAAAALLLGLSGGIAFVGSRYDAGDLQTTFLIKDPNLTKQQAIDKADRCLDRRRRFYFIAWLLGLVAAILAVAFAVAVKPAALPHHDKGQTMQGCSTACTWLGFSQPDSGGSTSGGAHAAPGAGLGRDATSLSAVDGPG